MKNYLLALSLVTACTSDGGLATTAITEADARGLCAQSCDREQTCGTTSMTLGSCIESCVAEMTGWIRGDAFEAIVQCEATGCDASEDACLRQVAPLEASIEWQTACRAARSACSDADLCEVEGAIDAEGFGMVMRLIAPELVPPFTECLAEPTCDAQRACLFAAVEALGE